LKLLQIQNSGAYINIYTYMYYIYVTSPPAVRPRKQWTDINGQCKVCKSKWITQIRNYLLH